jgi:hypothetical protein
MSSAPPRWIKPQLAALVKKAPEGEGWLHEMKLDGYRMHARLEAGDVRISPAAAMTGPTNIPPSCPPSPDCRRVTPTRR